SRHPGSFVNTSGKVNALARVAIENGARVDVGYGSHFSFRMARIALDAGIVPDTLGADMHGYNTTVPKPAGTPDEHPDKDHMFAGTTRFSLVSAMTAMLALGLPLEHVVAMATINSAKMVGMDDIVGTLEVGRDADVSVLDDERGRWVLKDNEGTQVVADRMLTPSYCLSRGIRYEADASILPTALAA
ncbi:MAG TPA: amidohydrolase family protein, partial [Kofleriaceae bacterium]|nr:amidohydrolase family protein [Kofleriaceae bacterium]